MTGHDIPALETRIENRVDCDVVTVADRASDATIASILAPIAGGPHSDAVVEVAGAIADVTGAWVELFHVLEPGGPMDREQAASSLEAAARRLPDVETDTRLLESDDATSELIEQSDYYDLTVIGAPRKGRLKRFIFGSTAETIQARARNIVVMARSPTDERLLFASAMA